jgi:hypothetical protein
MGYTDRQLRRKQRKESKMNLPQKQMQVKIDPATLEPISCACGQTLFMSGVQMRRLPALMSPDGRAGFVESVVAKICVACGKHYTVQEILQAVQAPDAEQVPTILGPDGREAN